MDLFCIIFILSIFTYLFCIYFKLHIWGGEVGGSIKTGLTQFSKKDGTTSLDSKVETLEVMQPELKTNPNPKFYSRSRLLTVVID